MKTVTIFINGPEDIRSLDEDLQEYCAEIWSYDCRHQFRYYGQPHAILYIPYSKESWRTGYIEIKNYISIKTNQKNHLSSGESEHILESFYNDVLKPFCSDHGHIEARID